MTEPTEANGVNVHDDGNPLTGVHLTKPFIARMARPGVLIGLVVTGFLIALSMAILVVYLAPSVDRLTQRTSAAAGERAQLLTANAILQDQLETILEEQREERLVDDCLSLYLTDIEVAKGVAQVTLGDNLARSVFTDEMASDTELGQEIFDANTDLRAALLALEEYRLIDPPPGVCPHPNS
ncbi:MAG: hypothetical protein ABIO83_02400 [Ilumatobacteraceae bacterium]